MNFIGHYEVSVHKDNRLFTFGCLLPDLYRGFTKDYHRYFKSSSLHNDLLLGINFHIKTDHVFHTHPYFIRQCDVISKDIRNKGLINKGSHVVAHVLFELLLDRHILLKNRPIHLHYYKTLNKIDENSLKIQLSFFLDKANIQKIIRIFRSFKDEEYAQYLLDADGMTSSLQHILGNHFGWEFNHSLWIPFIENYKSTYQNTLDEFITDLKLKLHNA